MQLDQSVTVKSRYPLFWQAFYPPHLQELKIPVCQKCGNLIKVSSYDNVCCDFVTGTDENGPVLCNSSDISFDPDDGAMIMSVNQGVLSEFDADGNETINFKFLPTDGLQAFGLVDPLLSPPTFYIINLKAGTLETGNVNTGRGIPLGLGIDHPTTDGQNMIPISTTLQKYGSGGDLIHYKHGNREMGNISENKKNRTQTMIEAGMYPEAAHITNIVIGYKCHIPGWHCQVKINVDCENHLPYITTKNTKVESEWQNGE